MALGLQHQAAQQSPGIVGGSINVGVRVGEKRGAKPHQKL
jgi:hypothetical protein